MFHVFKGTIGICGRPLPAHWFWAGRQKCYGIFGWVEAVQICSRKKGEQDIIWQQMGWNEMFIFRAHFSENLNWKSIENYKKILFGNWFISKEKQIFRFYVLIVVLDFFYGKKITWQNRFLFQTKLPASVEWYLQKSERPHRIECENNIWQQIILRVNSFFQMPITIDVEYSALNANANGHQHVFINSWEHPAEMNGGGGRNTYTFDVATGKFVWNSCGFARAVHSFWFF